MSILPKLISIYRSAGYEPLTGYNSYHFQGWIGAPFTKFLKGNAIHGEAGLALQELMVLEGFAAFIAPRRILVIGNAHGWSTIALALMFPNAKVVAIDPGKNGNNLTNAIAQQNTLSLEVVEGYSPRDTGRICKTHLGGLADLVLIDAVHTNEAVLADFNGCKSETHDGTVWIFHDVINWNLVDSFQHICSENNLSGHILTRTPSGMAVAWKNSPQEFQEYVSVFYEDPNIYRLYRGAMIELMVDSMVPVLKKL